MSFPAVDDRAPSTQLGGGTFNHSQSREAEEEYDRLRNLARQELSKRSQCLDRAHQAYENGDGASAHELSEEGKRHGAKADEYNKQASDYIFRENNAHVGADTIDLHGQFVEEAEDILEQRIRYAQSQGQSHLHVIVGKGNHSYNHVQKIKPRVEQVCQELGLQYRTEHNEGRIYINLTGGPAEPEQRPPTGQQYHGGQQHGGQQHQRPPQQQFDQDEQAEQEPERSLLKCLKGCCVVM
ncbi:DUF1771-domain-containing protein [Rhizodiscina lignyota]|uniref:DUF1771-domain-containing protein n=1 Tax=Rhizodiscina lignyota TaxID=1504668 RepID=A0A9P4IND1_9PEZI|nr:DUF1771-domain-containing protein [Rhizodiscina lignyota]